MVLSNDWRADLEVCRQLVGLGRSRGRGGEEILAGVTAEVVPEVVGPAARNHLGLSQSRTIDVA